MLEWKYIVDGAFTILLNDRLFLIEFGNHVSLKIQGMNKNKYPNFKWRMMVL
jgi:hypothetical protein